MKTGFIRFGRSGRFARMAKRAAAPAVMAGMLSAAATGTAQAAQAEDVRKQGWEALPEDRKEAFRTGIAQIPDEVVELHRIEGARVVFVDGLLCPNGGDGDPRVKGLYWHDDKKIELAVSSNWSNAEISTAAAHEFGHFLYFQTYMFWTEEEKAQLEAEYDYWKQYSFDCTDREETFAVLYSMYRGFSGQFLSEECKAMLSGAEQDCVWLVERKTQGSPSWGFGPGMEMPEEETEAAAEGTDESKVKAETEVSATEGADEPDVADGTDAG